MTYVGRMLFCIARSGKIMIEGRRGVVEDQSAVSGMKSAAAGIALGNEQGDA
jgi:hypothetical protein